MPPKRKQNRSKKKNKNKAPIDAMADCVLPRDIMALILTRLPVKSILRFKSVCKPWYKLFSTPRFIKMHHHHQLSQNPKNEALIIHNCSAHWAHTMSLFHTSDKTPTQLGHPLSQYSWELDFVGCVNGMVCLSTQPLGQWIELWNPALSLSKNVPPPELDFEMGDIVSIGFGYDAVGDDFKIVRVVFPMDKKKKSKNWFEVYSSKSDSWTKIDVGFGFRVLWTKNDAIVDGNPYWIAKVDENEGFVLVCLDVRKMSFKIVPLLRRLNVGEIERGPLVDWDGSLAFLAWKRNDERMECVNFFVFDDGGKVWTLKRSFGPVELKVDRLLQCSKNGMILGECPDGKLFVFDSVNGSVEKIVIDDAEKHSYDIYGYTESLAYIKGMDKKW